MGLWLKNVKPVCFDAADDRSSVAVSNAGTISDSPLPGDDVLDAGGLFMSPGWTDLHVHVWYGGTDFSVPPDRAGLKTGVTAMADAGSAGEATLHGLRKYVIEPRPETIRAFINIGSIGLVASNRVPELIDTRFIDIQRTLAAIEANRDIVCGVKVRASSGVVGDWGITPVRIAKHVAETVGLPLMVHIGEPPPDLEEIFALLSPGDIVTHCFNGTRVGSITRNADVFEHACQLAEAGILMDVGHGAASYDFDVAAMSIAAGLLPYSISTDLHMRNVDGPVYDLGTTVSKLHAAGLGFERLRQCHFDPPETNSWAPGSGRPCARNASGFHAVCSRGMPKTGYGRQRQLPRAAQGLRAKICDRREPLRSCRTEPMRLCKIGAIGGRCLGSRTAANRNSCPDRRTILRKKVKHPGQGFETNGVTGSELVSPLDHGRQFVGATACDDHRVRPRRFHDRYA